MKEQGTDSGQVDLLVRNILDLVSSYGELEREYGNLKTIESELKADDMYIAVAVKIRQALTLN